MSRTNKKWEVNYIIAIDLLRGSEKYLNDNYKLEEYAKSLRNPIVFDNQVKGTTNILQYKIPNLNNEGETLDHLVGMSNIVLYIIKNRLYERWNSIDDFKNTLNALQVLIYCPKSINNKGKFKKDWLFNYDSIEISIQWNEKLKKYGITELEDITNGQLVSVDSIYSVWFNQNKMYL